MNSPLTRTHRPAGIGSPMEQDVVVALFDVLGFKRLLAASDLTAFAQRYREFLSLKLRNSSAPVIHLNGVDDWSTPSVVFSDTVLFWSHATPNEADTLLRTCSILLADALSFGWPLRGGIAAGTCVIDKTARVFVGQPIVDAHELEAAQDWIGAAIHPSCLAHPTVGSTFALNDSVIEYAPPLKTEYKPRIERVVEWGTRVHNWRNELLTMKSKAPQALSERYEATLRFVAYSRAFRDKSGLHE
jgi:hypothetical protein